MNGAPSDPCLLLTAPHSMNMGLVVIGNISRDTVQYGNGPERTFFGGAGLNVAISAARAGLRPSLISTIGEHDVSLLAHLNKDIDTDWVSTVPDTTCHFHIHYDEDGVLQTIRSQFGAAEHLNSHVATLPVIKAHYHICCRAPLEPTSILSRLEEIQASYSLDFIISSIAGHLQVERVRPWLPSAQCVFVNRREYEVLASICDVRQLPRVVITAGRKPVVVLEYGTEVFRHECSFLRVHEVTGAGDVFAGTYLA